MKKPFYLLLFLLPLLGITQTVSTYAGSGTAGATNATGTAARFNFPTGVAMDVSGNVYVTDFNTNLIRKISTATVVTTFAGSGGWAVTNGTGTAASFKFPLGIAIDLSGNVYVSDQWGHTIRKITPAAVVTTLAGSGTSGSTDATGTAASFSFPAGLAVDASGNVYVADNGNNKIRKITPAGVVTTIAGSGVAGTTNGTGTAATFSSPYGITIDASGNLFVSDAGGHKIRKITPAGVVTTFAGSGAVGSADATGTAATFNQPNGLTIDGASNIYVADYGNNKIRQITSAGVVTTYAGTGVAGSNNGATTVATFYLPTGVIADASGFVYVADQSNNKIRQITPLAVILPVTFKDFSGSFDSDHIELAWKTEVEENIDQYIIERSNDATNFVAIGNQDAHNRPSEYTFQDFTYNSDELNYYRIRALEHNANTSQTDIIAVSEANKANLNFNLFPDPVDRESHLEFFAPEPTEASLILLNQIGKVVYHNKFQVLAGKNTITLDTQEYPAGIYEAIFMYKTKVFKKKFNKIK